MSNKTYKEFECLKVVEVDGLTPDEFIDVYRKDQKKFDDILRTAGAIKVRGVQIDNLEQFQKIINSISSRFLNYIDGNSPRTKLSGNVYTSTEYDKTLRITMHNELSYSAKWPNKLFFSCLQPAEDGGETLLADSREILKQMNKEIVKKIEEHGVIYIRNLHSGRGIGPSWQDTFETNDKPAVDEYCQSYGMDYEWRENDTIRLKQFSKGIITHNITKEKVWFNQIDQFHPCQLGDELYEAMMTIYESPEEFPMYVTLGNGEDIGEDVIKEVLKTIDNIKVAPAWQKNELLIIDNVLVSHGRSPFKGERKVVVAMSE